MNKMIWAIILLFTGSASAAIPGTYYNTIEGKYGAELKTALHRIICNDTTGYLSYGSGSGRTWEGFYNTDRITETNQVLDMYSLEVRYFNGFNAISGMNIEHSFPKSWWGGSTGVAAYKELHHLNPSDATTNSAKSNYPLGETGSSPDFDNGLSKIGTSDNPAYSGSVFEPADYYKGDFARTYFYMVTAYQNYAGSWNSYMLTNNTYPVFNTYAINLLLAWHRQDPVSSKEILRNEAVFGIQNNRNPFIDYPLLAEHIWGNKSTVPFSFTPVGSQSLIKTKTTELINSNTLTINTRNSVPLQKTLLIQCRDLIDDLQISLSGNNAGLFTISTNSMNKADATTGTELIITYSPLTVGSHSATITISSTGMTTFLIQLAGNNQ